MTQPAPTCRDWPAGTRVRCVDNRNLRPVLTEGQEYTLLVDAAEGWVALQGHIGGFYQNRFKPVVRVPMGRGTQIATLNGYASAEFSVGLPLICGASC